jgi:hypothetical protein
MGIFTYIVFLLLIQLNPFFPLSIAEASPVQPTPNSPSSRWQNATFVTAQTAMSVLFGDKSTEDLTSAMTTSGSQTRFTSDAGVYFASSSLYTSTSTKSHQPTGNGNPPAPNGGPGTTEVRITSNAFRSGVASPVGAESNSVLASTTLTNAIAFWSGNQGFLPLHSSHTIKSQTGSSKKTVPGAGQT